MMMSDERLRLLQIHCGLAQFCEARRSPDNVLKIVVQSGGPLPETKYVSTDLTVKTSSQTTRQFR